MASSGEEITPNFMVAKQLWKALVAPQEQGINQHGKEGFVQVTVKIPGLKTKKKGVIGGKRIVDASSCTLRVVFGDMALDVTATILSGTKAGTKYKASIEKEDLSVSNILPEPTSKYEVADEIVRIFVKRC